MILTGIIGDPISHSLSPLMHFEAFKALKIKGAYVPFHVLPEELSNFMTLFKKWNFRGLNVTVPHKEAILKFCDTITKEAKAVNAVNTLIIKNGKITGTNTDVYGYEKILRDSRFPTKGKRACILGAGGAARAVLQALYQLKIKVVFISNRTEEKALTLQKEFSHLSIRVVPWREDCLRDLLPEIDLLINATSLGLKNKSDPFYLRLPTYLSSDSLVSDLVYRPQITPFLKVAQKRKLKILTGEGMLLHQGARAFELWTGKKAPLSAMKKALGL